MNGQTIFAYRILEKLGGGGMGMVYKAADLRFLCRQRQATLCPNLFLGFTPASPQPLPED